MSEKLYIKAFKLFDSTYQCNGHIYELNKWYEIPESKVIICANGFHCAPDQNVDNTVFYYFPYEDTVYGLVEIGKIIDSREDKIVTNRMRLVKKLGNNFDVISKYSKEGKWIAFAGNDRKVFDYEKALDVLIEIDKSFAWVYYASRTWKVFDYDKALDALIKIDKTGEIMGFIVEDWYKLGKNVNYEKAFNALVKVDKTGEWVNKLSYIKNNR